MAAAKTTKRRRKPFGTVEPYKVKGRRETPGKESTIGRQASFDRTLAYEEAEAKSRARTAMAKERATKAKLENDQQPTSRGPRGSSRVAAGRKVVARGAKATNRFDRSVQRFLRMGTASPRRVLMLELVAVMVIQTVDQLAAQHMPEPSAYVPAFLVYLVLGFVAEVGGDGAARVATGLGALVLVALVLANGPGIVRALQVASGQRSAPAIEGEGD